LIRILEVLATLKRAGAETMATSLACGLDRERFQSLVVSLYPPFPTGFESKLANCGVDVRHLGKRPGFDPRMYPRLRRVVRQFKPDVIHTHSFVMRYTLPIARCAMIHTVHNLADREVDAVGKIIHRIGYRRGVVPVAVASQVAQSFERMYRFQPVVIPNGIDTSRFTAGVRSSDHHVTIVSVARLDPQKNPRLLVDALPQDCRLLLVGDGSLRDDLSGLEGVQLLGVRQDIPEILASADIFALASDWEGHPIAVMEAMAAGLPVVVTAVGGVPEIVGNAGILVPPRDVRAMAEALRTLAADPQRRAELGRRAHARAAHFDVRCMIDAYAALFEKMTQR
jgi:glycosyltransferase involved in cell wall biosynthesis